MGHVREGGIVGDQLQLPECSHAWSLRLLTRSTRVRLLWRSFGMPAHFIQINNSSLEQSASCPDCQLACRTDQQSPPAPAPTLQV
jgi:hypothetical protein